MDEIMSGARAAKAALIARQCGERQALRAGARNLPSTSAFDMDRHGLRALIDHEFADRFARILRETPVDQRAAALARLRELRAASLAGLKPLAIIRPSRLWPQTGNSQALAVRHRAERRALAQQLKATPMQMSPGFQEVAIEVTIPARHGPTASVSRVNSAKGHACIL